MNIFKTRKKFEINQRDPVFKVKYLGNVQTAMMKGEGCVDKPTGVLWNNYARSSGTVGINMQLTLGPYGMKAQTQEQGLTEYRAHRISYCIAHPKYPKLFVWVYRHEGKRMKVELRCHAVLCKSEDKAKAMAVQLHDKLTNSLNEFMRDKTRRQNSRLAMQNLQRMSNSQNSSGGTSHTSINRSNSGINPGMPLRKKMLSTGQKFKPSVEHSSSAPKMLTITEDHDGEQTHMEEVAEEVEEEQEEVGDDDEDVEEGIGVEEVDDISSNSEVDSNPSHGVLTNRTEEEDLNFDPEVHDLDPEGQDLSSMMYSLEIGNDIEALKKDHRVQHQLNHIDSDDNSSESGFSEQDAKESSSTGSAGGTSCGGETQSDCDCNGRDCINKDRCDVVVSASSSLNNCPGSVPSSYQLAKKEVNVQDSATRL